jgi:transcriptional regulatory protein RtcR
VDEEIDRLKGSWRSDRKRDASVKLTNFLNEEQISALDLFDRLQLEQVVDVCSRSRSLSDAGRLLFNQSRSLRSTPNDADRLRKYLARFGLDWASVSA